MHRLLDEAAAWLVGRGIHPWPSPYPRAGIEPALADRTLFRHVDDVELAGGERCSRFERALSSTL